MSTPGPPIPCPLAEPAGCCLVECPATSTQSSITLSGDWDSAPCSCGLNGTYSFFGFSGGLWYWGPGGDLYLTDLGGGFYSFTVFNKCSPLGVHFGEGALTCDENGHLVGSLSLSWNGAPFDDCAGTTGTVTFGP